MIDHPKNLNYPTYWHARGYGLFALNPLGEKVFSKDKKTLNFKLKKGESVTFHYRVVVKSGALTDSELEGWTSDFAK
jgi:Methane oxygenase PmoA